MPRQTILDDSAEIYQIHNQMSEKEKWRGMSSKQRLEYFNQYYLAKLLCTIAGISFVVYLIYTMVSPKNETALYVAVVDGCISTATCNELQESMIQYLDIDTDKNNVIVDDSYYLSNTFNNYYQSIEKFMTYVAAKEIDVVIAPASNFESYATDGYFAKLSDYLPTQIFSSNADEFLYASAKDDSNSFAYGIYLKDYTIYGTDGQAIVSPVVGIIVNSEYPENASSFIQYLLEGN